MRDFALIQLTPGQLLVGWGPFEDRAEPEAGKPAFYINDYFLEGREPWKIPASWEVVGTAELLSRLELAEAGPVEWEPLDDASFQSLFWSAHSALKRGEFAKIVPVAFERGVLSGGDPAALLVPALPALPPALWAYGYRRGQEGMVGATPETLFTLAPGVIETMAVAGTRGLDRLWELLEDPKEREEHQLVVGDIEQQLADLGRIDIGETEIVELPTLAHLKTHLTVHPSTAPSFEEIVRRLHPTAALGSWPRNDAAQRWLREADREVRRGTFGAPFGALLADGSAICIVAIRNVAWEGSALRIGSGAGVLAESTLESERKEFRRKREQVRALFRLTGRPARVEA